MKLSEYHSAIGLASLKNSNQFIKTYKSQYSCYLQLFSDYLSDVNISIFTDKLPKTTFSIRNASNVPNQTLTYQCLAKNGFEVRPWWGSAISQTPISKYCLIKDDMKNSIFISEQVIGLPLGEHIDYQAQLHIVKSIAEIFKS